MHIQDKTLTPPSVGVQPAKGQGQRRAARAGWLKQAFWIVAALTMALLVALPWIAPYFYIFIATEILILGLLAASFNLVFGYTGMLSFGHAAFFGIGSYAVAMLLQAFQWPLLACLLVAVVVATLGSHHRVLLRAPERGVFRDADAGLWHDGVLDRASVALRNQRQ